MHFENIPIFCVGLSIIQVVTIRFKKKSEKKNGKKMEKWKEKKKWKNKREKKWKEKKLEDEIYIFRWRR